MQINNHRLPITNKQIIPKITNGSSLTGIAFQSIINKYWKIHTSPQNKDQKNDKNIVQIRFHHINSFIIRNFFSICIFQI